MKLVSRDVSGKDGAGTVVLRPEEPEDMWAIYNLISEGDLVRTTTFRKVVKESATGSTTSNKIRLNLTIQVQRMQFDPDTCVLRLSGPNREESEHVKVSRSLPSLDRASSHSGLFWPNRWEPITPWI